MLWRLATTRAKGASYDGMACNIRLTKKQTRKGVRPAGSRELLVAIAGIEMPRVRYLPIIGVYAALDR